MSAKEERDFDRRRLYELIKEIEPAKNEHIAREAIEIASKWLLKAERQAEQIRNLEDQQVTGKLNSEWLNGFIFGAYMRGME